jgi:hypothetical protein
MNESKTDAVTVAGFGMMGLGLVMSLVALLM